MRPRQARTPQGASAPKFNNTDTQIDAYTLIVGLTWDQESAPSYAILRRLAVQLEDELQRLPGTRHTRLFGDPQEEILVTVPPYRLASHGLSSADVARSIARSDAKVAAGQMRGAGLLSKRRKNYPFASACLIATGGN